MLASDDCDIDFGLEWFLRDPGAAGSGIEPGAWSNHINSDAVDVAIGDAVDQSPDRSIDIMSFSALYDLYRQDAGIRNQLVTRKFVPHGKRCILVRKHFEICFTVPPEDCANRNLEFTLEELLQALDKSSDASGGDPTEGVRKQLLPLDASECDDLEWAQQQQLDVSRCVFQALDIVSIENDTERHVVFHVNLQEAVCRLAHAIEQGERSIEAALKGRLDPTLPLGPGVASARPLERRRAIEACIRPLPLTRYKTVCALANMTAQNLMHGVAKCGTQSENVIASNERMVIVPESLALGFFVRMNTSQLGLLVTELVGEGEKSDVAASKYRFLRMRESLANDMARALASAHALPWSDPLLLRFALRQASAVETAEAATVPIDASQVGHSCTVRLQLWYTLAPRTITENDTWTSQGSERMFSARPSA